MLRVLFESRARRQRRFGGMVLSIATHLAIIGAVTATTVHATRPSREEIIPVRLAPPVHPAPPTRTEHQVRPSAHTASPGGPVIVVDRIHISTVIQTTLPPIDLSRSTPDDATIGGATAAGTGTGPRSIVDGDATPDNTDWRGSDLLMRIVTPATPRYPELLRQAGIDGRVLVRFVVDTVGKIDMNSVQVLESTHDLFARAVRDILGGFRFRPAEARGHRVRAMAEMPFEFHIRK